MGKKHLENIGIELCQEKSWINALYYVPFTHVPSAEHLSSTRVTSYVLKVSAEQKRRSYDDQTAGKCS